MLQGEGEHKRNETVHSERFFNKKKISLFIYIVMDLSLKVDNKLEDKVLGYLECNYEAL